MSVWDRKRGAGEPPQGGGSAQAPTKTAVMFNAASPCPLLHTYPYPPPPPHTREHVNHVLQVVPVHWTDVVEAQLLEERTSCPANHAACILVYLGRRVLNDIGELLGHALRHLPQLTELAVGLREKGGQGEQLNDGEYA
jgi:hypothetical protein